MEKFCPSMLDELPVALTPGIFSASSEAVSGISSSISSCSMTVTAVGVSVATFGRPKPRIRRCSSVG
jgi:hypothetical protein